MRLLGLLIAIALLVGHGQAAAQVIPGQPNPTNGKAIAEKLCINCHLIGGTEQREVPADVPSFAEIANQKHQSEARIVGQIMLPAHPMPVIPLERGELADLAAYILTLRDKN
jgi:cytochrome c